MNPIQFDIYNLILNPFVLMFLTIILGLLFGKIKFGKFNFGSSGALFIGMIVGWLAYNLAEDIYAGGDASAPGMSAAVQIIITNSGKVVNSYFFTISLILFVASIGLLAAKDLGIILKKYGTKFVILSIIITFVGATATYVCTAFADGTNSYAVTGVYTGAMTSSPGLAAALETAQTHATEVAADYDNLSLTEKEAVIEVLNMDKRYAGVTVDSVGHFSSKMQQAYINQAQAQVGIGSAVGYPFGVIVVILALNFINVIFKFDVEEEKRLYKLEMEAARNISNTKEIPTYEFDVMSFFFVCLVGYVIGSIKLYMGPLGYVSLEATGGVLISSLVFGYIGKLGPLHFRMDPKTIGHIRDLALSLFLTVVGLNYGYGAVDAIMGSGAILVVISVIVGIIAITVGFIIGRYVFKLNWIILSGAICGGMTSTPGLGAATEAIGSDDPAAGYGATYPFALLGMVIFSIILNKLPLL